jgi:hypothetical protein
LCVLVGFLPRARTSFHSTTRIESCDVVIETHEHNGDFKELENHEHALALYFMYYNFCRIHQTLRVTPAMEAEITDHVWDLDELIALLE